MPEGTQCLLKGPSSGKRMGWGDIKYVEFRKEKKRFKLFTLLGFWEKWLITVSSVQSFLISCALS